MMEYFHMNKVFRDLHCHNIVSCENNIRLALVALPYGEGPQVIMPLGLQNISAYIKKNTNFVKTKIFDYSDLTQDRTEELADLIEWKPDIVGISIYSSHVDTALVWGKIIKSLIPNSLLFCGGPHISLAAENFMQTGRDIYSVAFKGEGEYSVKILAEIFNRFKKQYGESIPAENYLYFEYFRKNIVNAVYFDRNDQLQVSRVEKYQLPSEEWVNPLMEYDSERLQNLIFTDRRDGRKRKAIAFTSSRGCPLTCSFCAIIAADAEGPRWRAVDADILVNWIKEAREKYDFQHVYMMDANFFVKKDRVLAFSKGLHQIGNGDITWSSSSTVRYLLRLREELPILVKEGLRLVEMGVESGSQTQLNYMNKRVTVQENIDAIRALQENKIDIGLDFIMFYHDQTKTEIIENLTFLIKSGMAEHESLDHYFNLMMLYPGTPVRIDLEKKLGKLFSLNRLPNSRELISDHGVKKIYHLFIDKFAKPWLHQLEEAISLNLEVIRNNRKNKLLSSSLSLRNVYLRHIPFKVLWELCHADDLSDMNSAVKDFNIYTDVISNTIKENTRFFGINKKYFGIETVGVGGRKEEIVMIQSVDGNNTQ
ncbi:hypothetical protein C6H69_22425 [Photorhabdus luminescens]|nr:hypothetical protein C6H69_22425 [Photorhabdus luminescens]